MTAKWLSAGEVGDLIGVRRNRVSVLLHEQYRNHELAPIVGGRRMVALEKGSGSAIDPTTGNPSTFFFAPVHLAKWTFVAVIEHTEAPDRNGDAP